MPARPIVRSAQAEKDLLDIWLYIAGHDPAAADRVLDAIERKQRQLAIFPLSGATRDDIRPGIRQVVSRNYIVFYRVSDTAVEIVRVVHGKRKIDRDIIGVDALTEPD